MIPAWAMEACLDDSCFAAAYEAVSPERRALMKTAIARLHAWHSPLPAPRWSCERRWQQGFFSRESVEPMQVCLLLFDAYFASPAKLLAALMPALSSGVGTVLAVRTTVEGDLPCPPEVLAALELAGQENVVELLPEKARALFSELARNDVTCAALTFGRTRELVPPGFADGAARRIWNPEFGDELSVWLEGEDDVDLAALSFAHPQAKIIVYGAERELPRGLFQHQEGDFASFLSRLPRAAYAPDKLLNEVSSSAALALGPGHEACWIWPALCPDFFLARRLTWGMLPENVEREDT